MRSSLPLRRRQQGLHAQQVVERGTLRVVQRHAAHRGRALLRRKVAQLLEVVRDDAALLRRQSAELLHGSTHLPTLVRCEPLHHLSVADEPVTLLRRHGVQLRQAVQFTLLGLRGKLVKARLPLQGLLLLGQRKTAVLVHPLGEMLALRRTVGLVGPRSLRAPTLHRRGLNLGIALELGLLKATARRPKTRLLGWKTAMASLKAAPLASRRRGH